MKQFRYLVFALLFGLSTSLKAASITYRILEYDNNTGCFVLAPCGERPVGSYAEFENEYGATSGNRYNQIPRNKQATLWLMGWDGCTIESVTLSMCSNNNKGTASMQILLDNEVAYKTSSEAFDHESWFGRWVSKDLGIYVDIEKDLPTPISVPAETDLGISIKGGTQEGSVYLHAVTIEYTPAEGTDTESPMGWIYEKIEAKGKVQDGDVVMIYREGNAAGDIDGMEQSKYLDAIAVKSTSSVDDPFISLFTLHSTDDGHWTMTDQYEQTLGATQAQSLAWDEGVQTWDITLGYDGATIASTNSKYGSLRFNAPAGSYPRFWNYTSTSLKLPYLYRQSRQQQPVISNGLQLSASHREVEFGSQDTLILRYTLKPATATDQRVRWQSSDETVARVRSGVVEIIGLGEATITATSMDGGSEATCTLSVVEPTTLSTIPDKDSKQAVYWDLTGRRYSHPVQENILLIKKKANQ